MVENSSLKRFKVTGTKMPKTRWRRAAPARKAFGSFVRQRRQELGLSLRGLSERTNIPRSVLSRLERGEGEQVFGSADWIALGRELRIPAVELMRFAEVVSSSTQRLAKVIEELGEDLDAELVLQRIASGPEPRDPRYLKASGLLASIWRNTASNREAWRTVEEFLEIQDERIRRSGARSER